MPVPCTQVAIRKRDAAERGGEVLATLHFHGSRVLVSAAPAVKREAEEDWERLTVADRMPIT